MMCKLCDKYKYHKLICITVSLDFAAVIKNKVTVYSNQHVLIRSFMRFLWLVVIFSLLQDHRSAEQNVGMRSKSSSVSTQNLIPQPKNVYQKFLSNQKKNIAKIGIWDVERGVLINKPPPKIDQKRLFYVQIKSQSLRACIIWHPLNRIPTWQMRKDCLGGIDVWFSIHVSIDPLEYIRFFIYKMKQTWRFM